MGRKRRMTVRTIKRVLPTVFSCPRCGNVSVRVSRDEGNTRIACGNCNLATSYQNLSKREPVDIYNDFVDWYMKSGTST